MVTAITDQAWNKPWLRQQWIKHTTNCGYGNCGPSIEQTVVTATMNPAYNKLVTATTDPAYNRLVRGTASVVGMELILGC